MIPDNVEKIIMTKEDYDRNVEQLLLEKINAEQEIERLNNIINEFDNFLFRELQTYGGGGTIQEHYDKLQELKGVDKE